MRIKSIIIFTCSLNLILLVSVLYPGNLLAEDGYELWLRYKRVSDPVLLETYKKSARGIMTTSQSPTMTAVREELKSGLTGLLGTDIPFVGELKKSGIILAGTPESSDLIRSVATSFGLDKLPPEGYIIQTTKIRGRKTVLIASNTETGVLYGTFHFLRLLQTFSDISKLSVSSSPAISYRLLNHWDNLNRSVERGYAGLSLWDWNSLPDSASPRYKDYARANASIGINGTVITNVNANALILSEEYLKKVKVLADIFRPYGIRIYLTARFSAPQEAGKLPTSDPLDPQVKKWWENKASEIYSLIPDFGGFLVKANSEGQPGPQNYNRTHAEGANMLADAVAPYGGIVMWRAFVYDNNVPDDRAKQAYNEFVPLDGKFRDNVIMQVKNGPVDFQPREPFHPLFGAMKDTPVMPEFQITQEYLGASVHLVYLAPLFEECLKSDTYAKGKGTTVAKIIDGSAYGYDLTAMAGVANTGNVTNWTGHPFSQANWYAYGRLAWDPYLSSEELAVDWIRMTFSNDKEVVETIKQVMMQSREIAVNYMTPLGLHHIMYAGHHYGPGPWVSTGRQDWTSVYYHRASKEGIGFNRSSTGSNAAAQYFPEVREIYNDMSACPENLLLWFHHMPWDHKMRSGLTLWDELCSRYDSGVKSVKWMQNEWDSLKGQIDTERFEKVTELLKLQLRDAQIWKDGCLLYFQTFSGKPFPESIVKPVNDLKFYINHRYTDIPGISPGRQIR
jgi:alpha-glucuronidase